MRNTLILCSSLLILLPACGGDDDDDAPPPPPQTAAAPTGPQTPAGQVMVTVAANSTPPGAMVVGGGRQLGTTPLQTQVPIPAPQPGQPAASFAFTFTLEGYQPATINATPVNNTISLTAALAPAMAAQPVGVAASADPGGGAGGPEVRVRGRGGGPIYDNHTTTGTAVVTQGCVIDRLSVTLNGTHSYFQDLHITLRDPDGRSYSIARGGRRNPFRTHRVRRAAGRQARGTWRLAVADRLAQDSGILRSWSMSMTCR